jgi:phosphoglycerol transferase MdoB-like AlkP superfamily enzyme
MNEKNQAAISDAKPAVSSPTHRAGKISWDVAGRIGLLFAVLCSIKLVMLVGLRAHLFEIHWRVDSEGYSWLDRVAFFAFAILVALHLWRLGDRCATGGVKTIRTANLCVLILGAVFIFLASDAGGKHLFTSLMDGAGTWRDAYAAFFTEPPIWSVWLLMYLMFYFVLLRLGMERLVLRLTAVMAAVYIVLFLRYLIHCREAVVAADCVGFASLVAGWRSGKSLGWFWQVLPGLLALFFVIFFRSLADDLMNFRPQFTVLSGWMLVILAVTTAVARRGKFFPAWSWLLPFALVSSLLLVNTNYDYALNYMKALYMGMMLPHYFLGEFILAGALFALATLYRRFLPSGSLWWLDAINLLLIAFALADLRLSQIMGVRLDWQAIRFGADFKMVWRQAEPYLPDLLFGLVMLASLYAVAAGLLARSNRKSPFTHGGWFFVIAFLLLGVAGSTLIRHDKAEGESAILLAETSPWFNWTVNPVMDEKTFVATARTLDIGKMLAPPAATPMRPPRHLNVVLIFQESSFNRYLSLFDGTNNTQPLLSAYTNRMELFPNFFSDFPGSVNARFATLSGLYPVQDYDTFTFNHVGVKSIFEILHEHGYVSSVFDSASLDYTGFRDFLRGRGIDAMYDADTMAGRNDGPQVSWGLNEGVTLAAIRSEIKQYAAGRQKFFLSYFPVAPHSPFDGIPQQFQKFMATNRTDYVPQYKNELLYLDWGIASIVTELKNDGLLDNTLVIITDDHGEMLGENGGPIGHGWAITPQLTNIPLIIMDPDHPGYRINDTVGSQVDLLPTILDLLGIPEPPSELYQGISLYSSSAQETRKIYLNSFQQYAVVDGKNFLWGDRETGASSTNSLKFYSITNSGPRTFFPKQSTAGISPPPLSTFDKFQENFLQNYSRYSQMIRPPSAATN